MGPKGGGSDSPPTPPHVPIYAYLENYKSDPNLKCINAQDNNFVIKYIIW